MLLYFEGKDGGSFFVPIRSLTLTSIQLRIYS